MGTQESGGNRNGPVNGPLHSCGPAKGPLHVYPCHPSPSRLPQSRASVESVDTVNPEKALINARKVAMRGRFSVGEKVETAKLALESIIAHVTEQEFPATPVDALEGDWGKLVGFGKTLRPKAEEAANKADTDLEAPHACPFRASNKTNV